MALKDASREVRLQWFARQVIDAMWQGGDVDGGDVQQWAKSAGLIDEHTVTDADLVDGNPLLDTIENAEHLSAGDDFYTFSKDLENVDWSQIQS